MGLSKPRDLSRILPPTAPSMQKKAAEGGDAIVTSHRARVQ